ncbi:MAG: hypothetical protein FJ286_08905 [Planctomycetes bacterium]|nr:hypothetical protein [Planctomycetota bacterium]
MLPTHPDARRLFVWMLFALAGGEALAQSFSLSVDSQSNLYAAGQASLPLLGGGTLPPAVALASGTGRVLTFASVSGSVSYNDVDAPPAFLGQYNGPDGGAVNFQDANWPNNYLTTSGTPGLLPPSAANAPTTFYMDMASAGGVSGLLLYPKLRTRERKARDSREFGVEVFTPFGRNSQISMPQPCHIAEFAQFRRGARRTRPIGR